MLVEGSLCVRDGVLSSYAVEVFIQVLVSHIGVFTGLFTSIIKAFWCKFRVLSKLFNGIYECYSSFQCNYYQSFSVQVPASITAAAA